LFDMYLRKLTEATDDLAAALILECDKESAVELGTISDWRKISRKIRWMERMFQRDKKALGLLTGHRDFSYAGYVLLVVFATAVPAITGLLISFSLVNAVLYLMLCLFKLNYTLKLGTVVWLLILLLHFLLKWGRKGD